MTNIDTQIGGSKRNFPKTSWTLILNAKDKNGENYKESLEYLVSSYWKPVYTYMRIVWHMSNEDAKDLTQEFFANFIESEALKTLRTDKAKFRTFVIVVLKHFLLNKKRSEFSQKRGGGQVKFSFDDVEVQPEDPKSSEPSDIFEREWAKTVIENSLNILKRTLDEEGKGSHYKVLEIYTNRDDANPQTYSSVALELGLKKSDVRNYLVYTRDKLRLIMTNEISKYVADSSQVQEELLYIMRVITVGFKSSR
ncbi:MAG: sigma-70 family RNA polymerase sigma factor [Planctomycetes bacterium]|nr:sigma-70 family RNA polymerase sigma factor [Planctomycetota bacterium]